MKTRENVETITPYDSTASKTEQVESMFNSIAPAYDFMNRAMTLGIDRRWRAKAVKMVARRNPAAVLDIATGTGDLALLLARSIPDAKVTGVDLSEGMIEIGRRKVRQAGLESRISLNVADCLNLPFPDNSFDAITVAYGVRNFENLLSGYREMARVLRPGGLLCVVELSTPVNPLIRPFYRIYTRGIIPLIGRLVSRDTRAYTYLPQSIEAVAQGEEMLGLMRQAGLTSSPSYLPLTFGVCTIYTALKP